MSDDNGFWYQAQLYLSNAKPIWSDPRLWIIVGIVIVLGLITWLWLRKKKENKNE